MTNEQLQASTPDDLRVQGWSVAVHNDYHQDERHRTFWLLTHPDGRWCKGEAETDREALDQIRRWLRFSAPDERDLEQARQAIARPEVAAHIVKLEAENALLDAGNQQHAEVEHLAEIDQLRGLDEACKLVLDIYLILYRISA